MAHISHELRHSAAKHTCLKQQSAVEMLITYSWAMLIIALFVSMIFVLSFSKPASSYIQSSCNIEPALPCAEAIATAAGSTHPIEYIVLFSNNLGAPIYMPSNSFTATTTGLGVSGIAVWTGNCTPTLAPQGSLILCKASISGSTAPPLGSLLTDSFNINYGICSSGSISSCSAAVYKSTGTSEEDFLSADINIHNVTLYDSPSAGHISLNGVIYPNNTHVLELPGKYQIYAVPPAGYAFSSWSASNVILSSASQQYTNMTVSSNGTITANFVSSP
ncbi:MAG: InlB B-repeat-containing protein [Candidatus Micrarchaeia archaeon]